MGGNSGTSSGIGALVLLPSLVFGGVGSGVVGNVFSGAWATVGFGTVVDAPVVEGEEPCIAPVLFSVACGATS
jgi:hypothetical protein